MTQAQIRPLRWQDLPEVIELEQRCFPHDAWSAATWWQELAERPVRHYLVAETAAGIAGYAGLNTGATADVMTLAVDPQWRGHGYGQQLLDTLLAAAVASDSERVMLEVRADNTAALGLYQRSGFDRVHTRRGYYRATDATPAVDAIVMQLDLGPREGSDD